MSACGRRPISGLSTPSAWSGSRVAVHILLTDQLTCPRCGPEFGLILLADEMAERRVRGGRLGCANCRSAYPIADGVADLRVAGTGEPVATDLPADDERGTRTAALLGITGPSASVLVVEPTGEVANEMAGMLPEVHVLSAVTAPVALPVPAAGVLSRFRVSTAIPLRRASMRGAALLDLETDPLLDDIVRVLAPGGRLVVEPAGQTSDSEARNRGLEMLLLEAGVMVASTPGPR